MSFSIWQHATTVGESSLWLQDASRTQCDSNNWCALLLEINEFNRRVKRCLIQLLLLWTYQQTNTNMTFDIAHSSTFDTFGGGVPIEENVPCHQFAFKFECQIMHNLLNSNRQSIYPKLSLSISRFDCLAGCVNVELINIAESHYMPGACVSMEFIIALWVGAGVPRKSHYPNEPNIILINDQYRLLSWFKDHFDLPYVVDYLHQTACGTLYHICHSLVHLLSSHFAGMGAKA